VRNLILLSILVVAPNAAAYQDFALRPSSSDPARETESLQMNDRLNRVDELEDRIARLETGADSLRSLLSAQYAGSPLMKHKVWALEVHNEFDNPNDPQALIQKSQVYVRAFNPWDADRSLQAAVGEAPERAETHRATALYWFEEGRFNMDVHQLNRARDAAEHAVRCADAGFDDWLILAAVQLAQGQRYVLHRAAKKLVELRPEHAGARAYMAIAQNEMGMTRLAELGFRRLIDEADPLLQRRFEDLDNFYRHSWALQLTPSGIMPAAPPGVLEWWTRMMECDLLFGHPDLEINGWQTDVGEMFLLFGRPKEHAYYHRELPSMEEIIAFNRWGRFTHELDKTLSGHSLYGSIWIWIVDIGDREVPIVFNASPGYRTWNQTLGSRRYWTDNLRGSVPFNLEKRPDSPRPDVVLRARHARYGSTLGAARVECSFAVHMPDQISKKANRLRWELFALDGDDQRSIEVIERPVSENPTRGELFEKLSLDAQGANARLGRFSAVVDSGRYLTSLTVLDEKGDALAGQDESFLAEPHEGLYMSDLLLADSFVSYRKWPAAPIEFVRHGQVVVPHPEYQALPELPKLHVYYEVYDATPDARGRAHLDVLYEVFTLSEYDPLEVGRFEDVTGASSVIRYLHTDEKTGQTGSGTTVRGTELDLTELDPGHYVLVVTVSDRLSHTETRRLARFAR